MRRVRRAANDVRSRAGRAQARFKQSCYISSDGCGEKVIDSIDYERPDDVVATSEVVEMILDSLTPSERRLFELTHPDSQLSRTEIAIILGVTTRTVRLQVKKLRTRIWHLVKRFDAIE